MTPRACHPRTRPPIYPRKCPAYLLQESRTYKYHRGTETTFKLELETFTVRDQALMLEKNR